MGFEINKYYGFGFDYDLVNDDKAIDFFKNHIETVKKLGYDEVVDYLENGDNDIDEFIELTEDIDSTYGFSNCGYSSLLAEVMLEETSLKFGVYEDDDEGIYVMWEACYPWNMNDKEKNLTQDSLTEIIKKYADELGYTGDIDYFDVTVSG